MPHVYILRCCDETLYTGATKDLPRRLLQHQAGVASRYTRARLPVTLAWSRRCATWSGALREEYRIKQLRREEKEELMRKSEAARRRRRRRSSHQGPRT
jgi:putative endonuclease